MPHDAATSVIVRPSPITASTASYLCSATLISLMRERQGSAEAPVKDQPKYYKHQVGLVGIEPTTRGSKVACGGDGGGWSEGRKAG